VKQRHQSESELAFDSQDSVDEEDDEDDGEYSGSDDIEIRIASNIDS
jgi:hypothetical protein